MNSKRLRTLLIPVQAAVSILILYLLFQNVNLSQAANILTNTNIPILATSIIFFILSSFAISFALHGALKSLNAAPSFKATTLANFGGQLLSDVTPAKSGYFATPVLLNQLEKVPIEKGLMGVMAVGAGNFFVKASFSTIALLYFLTRIPSSIIDATMTNALIAGILVLLACGIGLTILVWTNYFSGLLLKLCKLPLVGIVIKKLQEVRSMFTSDKAALRSSLKVTIVSVLASITFSGISLFLLAQAIGMTEPTLIDMLFMGPLTAAFMYVPITFAGLGLQEAAYAFLLTGISTQPTLILPYAVTFALLVRLIATTTDLVGLPPVLKTSTGLIGRIHSKFSKHPSSEAKLQDGLTDEPVRGEKFG
ncbi:MAG: lysylphosphatidylglycerol synthase transmembrane domain-containing protein [Candidatus Bathyarchaeia archaeon]